MAVGVLALGSSPLARAGEGCSTCSEDAANWRPTVSVQTSGTSWRPATTPNPLAPATASKRPTPERKPGSDAGRSKLAASDDIAEQPAAKSVIVWRSEDEDPFESVVTTAATDVPPPPQTLPPLQPIPMPADGIPLDGAVPIEIIEPLPASFIEYTPNQLQPIPAGDCKDCDKWGPVRKFLFYSALTSGDIGIGQERVAFAPFQIEQAQPLRNIRTRFDSGFGLRSPDRAEYFWAAAGDGPAIPKTDINYYDFRYITETGGDKFSMTTDLPVRVVDYADVTTGGLSNISIATKTAIVAGENWYVSNLMRFYLPFGAESHGTSNGHMALEPGLLARYRWSNRSYVHSQVKWWIPFGGDTDFDGQVLNYGVGFSYIWYESDTFAALPTLEFDGWSVLSGQKTLPDGTVTSVGSDSFVNIMPGVRYVFGPAGDLGLFELGMMAGFKVGSGEGWYDNLLRLELRWTY